jgi:hypothetical protein
VLIRDLVGLEGATLGTNAGNKVVQIVDQLAPELAGISLQRDTASSVDIDFTEPIVVEGKAGVALKRNGLTALDFAASKQGDSSLRLSIASALLPTDWVLLEPDQAGPGNLFRDQAGNAITDSDGSGGGVALGGAGNDVIDISGAAFSPTLFFNIIAGAGDDSLIGSAGDTALNGGPGADSMTGGSGRDEFEFVQGDSPVVTVALQAGKPASFAFAGGADLITDLSAGERVALGVANQNLRGLEGLRPMGDGFLALRGAMPDTGLVADESFFVVRGTYALSGANAVFNVGSDNGPDTLIVYDGASGASTSQTGLVLQGVTPDGLNTFVGGVSALADQSGEYQGEEVQRGSDGPDTLEGAGSDDRVLLGRG